MRSGSGGCVENSRSITPGRIGSAIHRCAIEEFCVCIGRPYAPSFSRARARPSGCRVVIAPVASARYSRCRDTAACTPAAAIGATMTATIPAMSSTGLALPPLSELRFRPPDRPLKIEMRSRTSAMRPTATTRPKTIVDTRMS
jgi:hypothetical protein